VNQSPGPSPDSSTPDPRWARTPGNAQRASALPAAPVRRRVRRATALAAVALAAPGAVLGGASASALAAGIAPLPASSYTVRHACGRPAPGQAGCLALQLVPVTAAARARTHPLGMRTSAPIRAASAAQGAYGLRPEDLHRAYGLPTEAPSPQTIGIVDAYDDPNIEADLAVYDREFSLPPCTSANGCFTKMGTGGPGAPLPAASGEWSLEIALDVEIAHATCQSCRIVLVEAESNGERALEAAENRAVLAGAQEISNSWGGPEPVTEGAGFDHPGVAITASAGDSGYLGWGGWEASERGFADYPASSPHVVAVGGTRLRLSESGEWAGETVWNDGDGATGGGCSARFPAPEWQQALPDWAAVGCGAMRASADIAAVADPYTGAAVYDSAPWDGYVLGWLTVGGTSLSSPLVASAFGLAGGLGSSTPWAPQALYENALSNAGALHDVTAGSNGRCSGGAGAEGVLPCTSAEEAESCSGRLACSAGPGYDGPTGLGTPHGLGAFMPVNSTPRFGGAATGSGGQDGNSAGGGHGVAATSEAGASPPPAAEPPAPQTAPTPAPLPAALSRLALARARHGGRGGARVDFSFVLSARSPVHVTLVLLDRARGASRRGATGARAVRSFSIVARRGRSSWAIPGAARLRRGRYRLTLTPAGGRASSVTLVLA
jgi:hypothetical protein